MNDYNFTAKLPGYIKNFIYFKYYATKSFKYK